jgi:hypothetical protein
MKFDRKHILVTIILIIILISIAVKVLGLI